MTSENRYAKQQALWVFGYGSLIWNPGFSFSERRLAELSGWSLRFWQASMDHRGTPDAPGRVATLIRLPAGTTYGVIYRIEGDPKETLAYLDEREKGGYSQELVSVSSQGESIEAVTYIGSKPALEFIGPEPVELTAKIISQAAGPSGNNLYYFQELCKNLEKNFLLSEYLRELKTQVFGDHF